MIRDLNNIPALLKNVDGLLQATAEAVGQYLEGKVLDMINSQGNGQWPPLTKSTKRKKGSSQAWVDTGELRAQIVHRILHDDLGKTTQVGIFESETGFIAACLEFGTHDTRAFVAGGMMHQGAMHIPERPLFRLTFDLEAENIEQLIADELGRQIDKYLL